MAPPAPGDATKPAVPTDQGYDPNSDIDCACIYGRLPLTDTKLRRGSEQLRLANEILSGTNVPLDDLSRTFFDQFGVTGDEPAAAVVKALQDAGDAMLRAVIYHSDGLDLSEQLGTGLGAGCFPTLSR